jgi:hypothetical protein
VTDRVLTEEMGGIIDLKKNIWIITQSSIKTVN